MTAEEKKVVEITPAATAGAPLHAGPGNGGSGHGERLVRVEAKLEALHEMIGTHGATKDDISKVKTWFLGGVLAALGLAIPAAIGVAYAVARLFGGVAFIR